MQDPSCKLLSATDLSNSLKVVSLFYTLLLKCGTIMTINIYQNAGNFLHYDDVKL